MTRCQIDAGCAEQAGGGEPLGIVGDQHGPLAGGHAVAGEIGCRRTGEHHAGPVVAGEDQRLLETSGGEHHATGAHLAQAVAQERLRRATLMHSDESVMVDAERGGVAEQRDRGVRAHPRDEVRDDAGRRAFRPPAGSRGGLRTVLHQQHLRPAPGGGQRRAQAGRTGADDHDVDVIEARLGGKRVGRRRRRPEPGEPADERLPARPFIAAAADEGLVVEAGGQEPVQQLQRGEQVEAGAGHAVDAAGLQPLDQWHGRGQRVRLIHRRNHMDEGVGLLRTRRHDAARTVQLEAAPDHVDAVGQERRCQRIARATQQAAAVEAEGDPPRAVDGAAEVGDTAGAHRSASRIRSVAVSRDSANQARQPATCCHHSRDGPLGLSKA